MTGSRARRAGAPDESLLPVWVRPGASRREVGGWHDGALAVRVTAKAVGGAATEAVLEAVAHALGLPHRQVWLVRGATSRRKVLGVALGQVELERRLEVLADPERY